MCDFREVREGDCVHVTYFCTKRMTSLLVLYEQPLKPNALSMVETLAALH